MVDPSRRDELVAAALAGELDGQEQEEFDALCAGDPALLRELHALQRLTQRLSDSDLTWEEPALPPGLGAKILAATNGYGADGSPEPQAGASGVPPRLPGLGQKPHTTPGADSLRSRGHGWSRHGGKRHSRGILAAAAAALLVVGGLGGAGIAGLSYPPSGSGAEETAQAAPTGPPGTLGAVENVALYGTPAGTSFEASVIAHTWGTETVLAIDGLPAGDSFEVVLVTANGQELVSGTFFGAQQTVTCRMNAAVMRADVASLQIRQDTGAVVASSSALPRT